MTHKKTLLFVAAYAVCLATLAQVGQLPGADAAEKQRSLIQGSMSAMDGKGIPAPTSRTIQAETQNRSYAATANAANEIKGDFKAVSSATREQFEMLARTKGKSSAPAQAKSDADSDLMVFVSFSMPTDMLVNYARQAKRFGAVLMMRGFVNDKMSQTQEAISRLDSEGVEWQVSPEPFKKFKIVKVPSIVLASVKDAHSVTEDGCATPNAFSLVSGDIKLIDALDKMSLRSQPGIAKFAKARLLADRKNGIQGSLIR